MNNWLQREHAKERVGRDLTNKNGGRTAEREWIVSVVGRVRVRLSTDPGLVGWL